MVDYLGLADQLKKALITYTESGGQGNPTFDTAQAIAVMLEKHGIACNSAAARCLDGRKVIFWNSIKRERSLA